MATVKTVSVKYSRKLNLGNYESADLECSVWVDIDEGDDLDAVMHALWAMAKTNVKNQGLSALGKDVPDVDLGITIGRRTSGG